MKRRNKVRSRIMKQRERYRNFCAFMSVALLAVGGAVVFTENEHYPTYIAAAREPVELEYTLQDVEFLKLRTLPSNVVEVPSVVVDESVVEDLVSDITEAVTTYETAFAEPQVEEMVEEPGVRELKVVEEVVYETVSENDSEVFEDDSVYQETATVAEVYEEPVPVPEVYEEPTVVEESSSSKTYGDFYEGQVLNGKIYHYCACSKCCGSKSVFNTASGITLYNGMEDPRVLACNYLPLGTVVEFDGILFTVEDRGGAPLNTVGHFDRFTSEGHSAALARGIHSTPVTIISLP